MKSFLYLIRKGDLYKIGHTKNFDKEINKIKPDEVLKKILIDKPNIFEARLFRRYKKSRLPETDYFKLTDKEVNDCKKQIDENSYLSKDIGKEFSISATASLLILLLSLFLLRFFNFGLINSIPIALLLSSSSFWLLFLFGSFGGYDSEDLPLFASWGNRTKAFFVAAFISSLSFVFFYIY